jgi:hypothetical protein
MQQIANLAPARLSAGWGFCFATLAGRTLPGPVCQRPLGLGDKGQIPWPHLHRPNNLYESMTAHMKIPGRVLGVGRGYLRTPTGGPGCSDIQP